jgi:hypothetical protein
MIPIFHLNDPAGRQGVQRLLDNLRLDPVGLALSKGRLAEASASVQKILADVAERGDEAIVESCRRFDDPNFTADQIRISTKQMKEAMGRTPPAQIEAVRRSIAQVREYQSHVMPASPPTLRRPGVELGLRFTPLDSAGLYFPGGHAAYPSSLIMLAAPAQVAGVKKIVVCTPPSKYGRSDLVLVAALVGSLTWLLGRLLVGRRGAAPHGTRSDRESTGPGCPAASKTDEALRPALSPEQRSGIRRGAEARSCRRGPAGAAFGGGS